MYYLLCSPFLLTNTFCSYHIIDIPDDNVFVYCASLANAADGVRAAHKNWTVYQKYADGGEKHAIG